MTIIESAADYLARGLFVLPLQGKCPILNKWQSANVVPPSKWQAANAIGLRCGPCGDVQYICVDIDGAFDDDGNDTGKAFDAQARLMLAIGENFADDAYYSERTPHGYHYIFKVEQGGEFNNEKLYYNDDGACIVETRGAGGQVRIAPSIGNVPIYGALPPEKALTVDQFRSILAAVYEPKQRKRASVQPVATVERTTNTASLSSSDSPAEHLRSNVRLFVDYLILCGWIELPGDDKYYSLQRPNADGDIKNHSVHILKDGGAVTVWSSKLATDSGETISPLAFIARENFNGDESAAALMWRRRYMTSKQAAFDPCNFAEFNAFEEVAPDNGDDADGDAPDGADWSRSIADAVRFGTHCCNAVYNFPSSLFESSPVLSLFVKAISPDNDARKRAVAFAAAFSAVSFLSSRILVAEHAAFNHVNKSFAGLLKEGTASYNMTLAPSGTGKDCGRRFIADIVETYADKYNGLHCTSDEKNKRFLFSSVASAQSFATDFGKSKKALVSIDEAGDFLTYSVENKTGAPYLRKFLSDLKEYRTNETAGKMRIEKSTIARQNGDDCITIERPALNAYFTGVEDKIDAIGADFVNDGTWGRFNFFFARKGTETIDADALTPQALEALYASAGSAVSFNLAESRARDVARVWAEIGDAEIKVEYTARAWAILTSFEKLELIEGVEKVKANFPALASILNQSPLKLWKTALTYAAARCTSGDDIRAIVVNDSDAENARRFILWQVVQLCRFLRLGYSVKKDDKLALFRRAAMQSAADDGTFTTYGIADRSTIQTGMNYRQLKRFVCELEKDGIITAVAQRGRGLVYKFTDDSTRKGF